MNSQRGGDEGDGGCGEGATRFNGFMALSSACDHGMETLEGRRAGVGSDVVLCGGQNAAGSPAEAAAWTRVVTLEAMGKRLLSTPEVARASVPCRWTLSGYERRGVQARGLSKWEWRSRPGGVGWEESEWLGRLSLGKPGKFPRGGRWWGLACRCHFLCGGGS